MTTQLDVSVGYALESTFGTAVTVTKFLEFTDESLDWNPTFTQGTGLRVGSRVARSARRALGKQSVTGDLTVEACSKGLGGLFLACLGTVVSTQRASTGVYQHNFTPNTSDPLNSYTFQKGIPPLGGGAANPMTFPGMVCSSMEFNSPNSDNATLKTSWVGREVLTATSYAAPSYPTPLELFEFVEGSITVGGAVTAATTTALATGGTAIATIRDATVSWDNHLDDGGFNLGGAGKRVRKPVTGMSEVKGHLTAEYSDNTLRDAYLNQTDLTLVLTYIGSTTIGSGSDHPALQFHIPNIRLEGELPKAAQGAPVVQGIDYTGFDNLSGLAPLIVSYVSTDVTP